MAANFSPLVSSPNTIDADNGATQNASLQVDARTDSPATSPSSIETDPLPTMPTSPLSSNSPDQDSNSTNSTSQTRPNHPMITRAKNNIFKPKHKLTLVTTKHPLLNTFEPTSVAHALQDPNWKAAMICEYKALIQNQTWELVPYSQSQNIIGCKWIFRIKRHPNGTIERYKARLVAKGFHQRAGVDYSETFCPVVKPTTVRLILCLALANGWPLQQLDVNNAFLHGTLSEAVYMSQPPGFTNHHFPNHVCKLRKALYGLKQAPRAWYQELYSFLHQIGFHNAISDASLFIYNHGGITAFFLVYVDDLILTGNDGNFLSKFVHLLAKKFSIKDLGHLHYFLGIEVIPTTTGLFLSQHKYICDLLSKTNMCGAKPVSTPLCSTASFKLFDGAASADATEYRKVVGALQYLSFTRPDISFAVNKLSQFMHSPSVLHWQAVKRVLRYLKSTTSYGLFLKRNSPCLLHAYSDADWGGDESMYSTSAYMLYLGGNPISWRSNKQKSVARSTTEAEYLAVANAASEVRWVQNLLQELGLQLSQTPSIYCDNIGTTYLCRNPVFHSRVKHIDLAYHFVRDWVNKGLLRVSYVSAVDQLADSLTKPLSKRPFSELRFKMGVANGNTLLRGHIR
ncbi:retrovirus-related pol polyprotein from transposon RE1 [Citrus sinensis]|nr:retrovirus-related pol polyprotein from transposon RE1 [Citrus sinensis]